MYDARMRGTLIAVEGIDGAGTTTQVRRLVEWLTGRGRPSLSTREPSTGAVGQLLRALLRGEQAPIDPAAVALLFAADRVDHVAREIAPALADGKIVVSDRYVMSSLAYQAAAGALPREFVVAINARAPAPDLTLLVDVPAEIAAGRRSGRGGPDELFDALDLQRRVAAAYLREVERERAAGRAVVTVDGRPSEDQVFAALAEAVARTCFAPGQTPS